MDTMDTMDTVDAANQSSASKQSANQSPGAKAFFPMVQKVPTVQSMGPCLVSP